ncbi:MAG: hypothetical protein K5894_05330 [Lachnospiraceae bacterium]|nr:hypothetical protein [Lachnospiraceae bacterium]
MDDDMALVGVLAGLGIMLVFAVFIALIIYIISAIATFKYLKVRNYKNAWMAFIPYANHYAAVEATYGDVEKIKLFGLEVPSVVVKLFPIIVSAASGIISQIPGAGSSLSSLVWLLQIAVSVVIYRDQFYRIRKEISLGFAIFANLFTIVGIIYLLVSCSGLREGQYDYATDTEVLESQA